MEIIFEFISSNPSYFAWVFGIVNVLWAVFLYFNNKRHEHELIKVQQSFDLDLERRKKIYEMKASQYEAYFRLIDSLHNKHRTDFQDIFVPIMNEFMANYLPASSAGDKPKETQAVVTFSEKISRLTRDGFEELSVINSETNSLRLTASDEVATLLLEINELYERMFSLSGKMMSDLVEITIKNNRQLAEENKSQLVTVGEQIKNKAAALREAMRNDLKQI